MPKIDRAAVPVRPRSGYPPPFDVPRLMSANADGRFVHKDGTPYPPA